MSDRSTTLAEVLVFSLIAIIIVFAVISIFSSEEPTTEPHHVESPADVEWIEINPPPGVEGPCYAFFASETRYREGYGFSGVHCPQQ